MIKNLNTDTFDCEFIDTKTGEKIGELSNVESYTISNNLVEKYKAKLNKIKYEDEIESGHIKADGVLCDLLDELGYDEITEIFDDLDKWYS